MDQQALSNLIALGEGFTTEFKRSIPADLGREVCAFANATGGVILIGVDDTGTVVGVVDHNRLKSQALWDRLALPQRSQNWLAQELGISHSYLSLLVNEGHAPPGEVRRRMQKVLGVEDFYELFAFEHPEDGR